jgi:hypothetical protein
VVMTNEGYSLMNPKFSLEKLVAWLGLSP